MKRTFEKDLYSILGINHDATAEKMRQAYLARVRVIHPDRFDRQHQAQDWMKANEMLAELNEAYGILRNPLLRAQYDELHIAKQQSRTTSPPRPQYKSEPSHPPAFELGELTPGQAFFASLPKSVQSRLLKRQLNESQDQFQIKLSSIGLNYVFVVVLLCWYWYLFTDADGAKWEDDTLVWYGGITLIVAGLIGRNCVTIVRWAKAKLKPYFYVTPIYFIKTEFDIVSFRPIWSLKDVSVSHNYKNGSYQNSDVVLKFDEHSESLSLSSEDQVDALFDRIRTYDDRLRSAYTNGDQGYFLNNDDFFQVPRSGVAATVLLSNGKQAFIYITSVIICGIGLIVSTVANEDLSQKRWVRHQTSTTSPPRPTPHRVVTPSYPEQSLPYSGAVRTWASSERVAPFEIKAAQGNHHLLKLVNAYNHAPVMTIFVRSGTTVEVEVPLGTYEVRYASGEIWYGYEYLFGPETSYSKADKTFTFEVVNNQIRGFTITLYKVTHGNLPTSMINPSDF